MKETEVVDLFEDVDLKNLKADIVPAKDLYIDSIKLGGVYFLSSYSIILMSLIISNPFEFEKNLVLYSILLSIPVTLFGAGMISVGIYRYVWNFKLFEIGISKKLKHGHEICKKIRALFGIVYIFMFFILLVLCYLFTLTNRSLDVIWLMIFANYFMVIVIGSIGYGIFKMEMNRLGLKSLFKNISEILKFGQ